MTFRALVLTQGADRKVTGAVETLDEARLPAGDVTVAVEFSTLNYKDGRATSGGRLVKTWPHAGGIDFAGTVGPPTISFKPGDKVVLNGFRRRTHWGGYPAGGVKGDWLVKLPATIDQTRHGDRHREYLHASRWKHGLKPAAGGCW